MLANCYQGIPGFVTEENTCLTSKGKAHLDPQHQAWLRCRACRCPRRYSWSTIAVKRLLEYKMVSPDGREATKASVYLRDPPENGLSRSQYHETESGDGSWSRSSPRSVSSIFSDLVLECLIHCSGAQTELGAKSR